MLSDLLNNIVQEDIKKSLMMNSYDEVICYPGSGADVFPCVLMELADLKKLGIEKRKPVYLFCDPCFTTDDTVPIAECGCYTNTINLLNGKINLSQNEVYEIFKTSGLFDSGYAAWKHVTKLICFREFNLNDGTKGYYEEIEIGESKCEILIFSCCVSEFGNLLKRYNVEVEGVVVWDWNGSFDEVIMGIRKLPQWIIQNRSNDKNSKLYSKSIYDKETADYICKFRGIENNEHYPETIGLYSKLQTKVLNIVDVKELFRLLERIEIPVGTDTPDGKFKDLKRLNIIQEEVESSELNYKYINGKNNYFKLYGQDSLEQLSKEFDRVVLVSSHADNWQPESKYKELDETIKGIFDNAATNAICVYIMKYIELPRNVLFAFTSDEECESGCGAVHLAKKMKKYFGKGKVDIITLDVTYGWCEGADFSIENDFIYQEYNGDDFIKKVCQTANETDYSWQFIKAADDSKSDNYYEYISSDIIETYMGSGLINVSKYRSSDDGADESADYDEYDFSVFSLCLPCSANNCEEMHDDEGFEISKVGVCNYTDFLIKVLKNL